MEKHYLIDESGDPEFFGKRGKKLWEEEDWHPFLIIGLVETENRKQLRKDIEESHNIILNNPLFKGIHSLSKENHYFHACKDHVEVRSAFFQFLQKRSDFKCYFAVGRKNPKQFIEEFEKSSTRFYFELVRLLIELPEFHKIDNHHFYLSRRPKTTNERFSNVLKNGLRQEMSEEKLIYQAEIVKSSEYPELCVIDYALWALQRFLVKGEDRYLRALKDKIAWLYDKPQSEIKENYKRYSVDDFIKGNLARQQ